MASVLDNWLVRRRFGRVQSMVDLVAPHRMDSGRGALPSGSGGKQTRGPWRPWGSLLKPVVASVGRRPATRSGGDARPGVNPGSPTIPPHLEVGAASVRYCRHRLGLKYGWASVVVLGLLA